MNDTPFDDFFHDPTVDRAAVKRALQRPEGARQFVRAAQREYVLHRLYRRPDAQTSIPRRPAASSTLWLAAATLVVGIGIGLFGNRLLGPNAGPSATGEACVLQGSVLIDGQSEGTIQPGVELQTLTGSGGVVRLSDGSQLTLEADSRYKVAASDANDLRQRGVLKRGGARFTVTPDPRRFVVEAGKARIAVLGTSFRVQHRHPELADDTAVAVAVQEGRVQVDLGKRSILLSAGDRQVFFSDEPKPRRRRGRLLELVVDDHLTLSSVRGQIQRFPIATPLDVSYEDDPPLSTMPLPGALVEVAIDQQSHATALRVLRPELKGTILRYDEDTRELTVIPVDSDSPTQTWPMRPSARISQRKGNDTELQAGRMVQIRLTTDWSAIEAVRLYD